MKSGCEIRKATSTGLRPLAVLLAVLILDILASGVAGSAQTPGNVLSRYLKRYRRIEMDAGAVAKRVHESGELTLPTEDGVFNIVLEPHDIRAPQYKAEEVVAGGAIRTVIPDAIHTYRGTVPGMRGSEARFSIRDNSFEGIVLTPGEWYLVEPMRNYDLASRPSEMVVYRASDIQTEALGTCGTSLAEKITVAQEFLSPRVLEAGGSLSVADIATEADYEYVASFGSSANANNAILDVMNQVDGIYRTQLSISLRVSYQHTWAAAGDPYTSTAPSTMLDEFRTYWTANFGSLNFDLAHMWTGKDMDGSTIGIAYVGVACNARSYSYGISQKFTSAPGKYILTAHEIGHNFGATHTEAANPPQLDCSNTIMNSSVGTGTSFCPYSMAEISGHATQYPSCLSTVSSGCDVNTDGQTNVLDTQSLVNVLLGMAYCPGNCDSNRDGRVDVLDLQLLVNAILGTATCP